MKTTICYLTGTGNSLWVARTLARELGEVELASIADSRAGKEGVRIKGDRIGVSGSYLRECRVWFWNSSGSWKPCGRIMFLRTR